MFVSLVDSRKQRVYTHPMSKTVLLLRHGKADAGHLGGTDHDRTLNERGRLDVGLVSDACKKHDLKVDLIVCSTSVRTYGTAALFAQRFGYDLDRILLQSALYLAEPAAYVDALIQHSQIEPGTSDSIMLVGHNPGMSQLASTWSRSDVSLPTSGLAHIELAINDWQELRLGSAGHLIQLLIPREL